MKLSHNGKRKTPTGYFLLPNKLPVPGLGYIQVNYFPRETWKSPNNTGYSQNCYFPLTESNAPLPKTIPTKLTDQREI